MKRKAISGLGAFALGFLLIVLLGKGVNGYLLKGMNAYVPNGIFLRGIVLGALNGLLAVGLVLIYRTNRIINFAQGELGAFSATLSAELVERFGVPFYLAVLAGLIAAVVVSAGVEFLIIRRFRKAPRLILTVVTIAVFQILGAIELIIPYLFNKNAKLNASFQTPLSYKFTFGQVIFTVDSLTVLVVAPIVISGLVWFLRGTGFGLAARAAAEDSDRARLLGVPVKRVSLLVWVIAGFLSALTAILRAPVVGFQLGAIGGFTLLMQALTAAVIARMESLPIAFGAAVLIGTMDQVVFFGTGNDSIFNGILLGIVIVALLLQRRRVGRLESASSSWQSIQEVRPVPHELRLLPEVRAAKWGLGGLALAVLAALPFLLTASRTSLVSVMMIYAIVGLSLVILTGWSGNVSFGQWAIAGVGALVAQKLATQTTPLDFFLILLIAGTAGAVVALLIGLPALRIQGLFLGVTTLAFAVAAGSWMFNWNIWHVTAPVRRPIMWGIWDVSREKDFYFVCLGFLLAALLVGRNLRRARFGRVLIGMRDNPKGAQALGVPYVKTKLVAFAASGFLAAVAGGLYAYHEQQLRADRFPAELSLVMFSLVVIGGMGSPAGAILGAIYVEGAQYFLPREFTLLATGFGLLVLLLFFPGGLGQLFYGARDNFLRWVAGRRKLLVPSLVADRRVSIDLSDAALAATGEIALSAEEATAHELAGVGS